jgi:hypothetical protein
MNRKYFYMPNLLAKWQAIWIDIVSWWNVIFEHQVEKNHTAIKRSRRPIYENIHLGNTATAVDTSVATIITEAYVDHQLPSMAAYDNNNSLRNI